MDDIAVNLSISKKTIYQYFKDKDELVTLVTLAHIEEDKKLYTDIMKSSRNSVEELCLVCITMRKNLGDINPSLLFDLKKYYPKAWELFIKFKTQFIGDSIRRNLEQGVKEGYFRENIDADILAVYRMEQVQMPFDPQIFPRDKFDFRVVQEHLFTLYAYGILTEKGKKEFERIMASAETIH